MSTLGQNTQPKRELRQKSHITGTLLSVTQDFAQSPHHVCLQPPRQDNAITTFWTGPMPEGCQCQKKKTEARKDWSGAKKKKEMTATKMGTARCEGTATSPRQPRRTYEVPPPSDPMSDSPPSPSPARPPLLTIPHPTSTHRPTPQTPRASPSPPHPRPDTPSPRPPLSWPSTAWRSAGRTRCRPT